MQHVDRVQPRAEAISLKVSFIISCLDLTLGINTIIEVYSESSARIIHVK